MKVLFLYVFLLKGIFESQAQTWEEFFRQKETQRNYLILQIGALKIQSTLLEESASIFRMGLDAIGSWKELEKEIHTVYFDSFKKLGPVSRAEYERSIGSLLIPESLLSRIESSRIYWQGKSLDGDFMKMNSTIHDGLRQRCLGISDVLRLILGTELEVEDADRARLIADAGTELRAIQKDLMRLQVLSAHRIQMNLQKVKWQKQESIY